MRSRLPVPHRSTWVPPSPSVFQRHAPDSRATAPILHDVLSHPIQAKLPDAKEDDRPSPLLGRSPITTGLPDRLKAGIETLSGLPMDGVRVHYHSPQPAHVRALAYTQGTEIHVAPGQERHLPHEAWHVVQQLQGRVSPTHQTHGVALNTAANLEREADAMGAKALQIPSHSPTHFPRISPPAIALGTPGSGRSPMVNPVLQRWVDDKGKWHPGLEPPDKENWEDYTAPNGQTRWRLKPAKPAKAEVVEESKEEEATVAEKPGKQEVTTETATAKKDYTTPFLANPAQIRYSQDSIMGTFKDGGSIRTLAADLKSGTIKPDAIPPILVVGTSIKGKKKLITLDNRRLWAFKEAGLTTIRCRWATPEEIAANDFKFTAGAKGKATIRVR